MRFGYCFLPPSHQAESPLNPVLWSGGKIPRCSDLRQRRGAKSPRRLARPADAGSIPRPEGPRAPGNGCSCFSISLLLRSFSFPRILFPHPSWARFLSLCPSFCVPVLLGSPGFRPHMGTAGEVAGWTVQGRKGVGKNDGRYAGYSKLDFGDNGVALLPPPHQDRRGSVANCEAVQLLNHFPLPSPGLGQGCAP